MDTEAHSRDGGLLRLLQLTSPALPIGAFAYSQGLEYAVQAQWVHDETSAQAWILGVMREGVARLDVPVLARLYRAWSVNDEDALDYWSAYLRASREAAELREEDRQLGMALARLLRDLEIAEAAPWLTRPQANLAALFALAAVRWNISLRDAVSGYLWSWIEAQVAAAVKLVPLGQTAGQRILRHALGEIPAAAEFGLALPDGEIGYTPPGLALAGAMHETQYTRLFLS